jgi:hypothetical protein
VEGKMFIFLPLNVKALQTSSPLWKGLKCEESIIKTYMAGRSGMAPKDLSYQRYHLDS